MFLAFVCIAPWALLFLYDLSLYLWRVTTYEIPYYGGRARGQQRPRAPSLMERPDGRRRRFSSFGGSSGPRQENDGRASKGGSRPAQRPDADLLRSRRSPGGKSGEGGWGSGGSAAAMSNEE